MTSSWFFLSTRNYDARWTTHQNYKMWVLSVIVECWAPVISCLFARKTSKIFRNLLVQFTGIRRYSLRELLLRIKWVCIDILRRLKDVVRRNHPEKWRTNILYLLHDNAPAHRSALFKDFLTKNSVTTLQHPSYSPDLATADFNLFRRLKSALIGRCFCDVTDIVTNTTEELKSLSPMASSRWQNRVFA